METRISSVLFTASFQVKAYAAPRSVHYIEAARLKRKLKGLVVLFLITLGNAKVANVAHPHLRWRVFVNRHLNESQRLGLCVRVVV